jgi:hypothetical protein
MREIPEWRKVSANFSFAVPPRQLLFALYVPGLCQRPGTIFLTPQRSSITTVVLVVALHAEKLERIGSARPRGILDTARNVFDHFDGLFFVTACGRDAVIACEEEPRIGLVIARR